MEFETGLIQVPEQTKRNPDKEGFLIKQGYNWKTWKKRYFLLKNNYLYYFALQKDSIPKGVILLDGVQCEIAEKETKRKYCFLVKSKKSFTARTKWIDRIYYFQAEREDEMTSWILALKNATPGRILPHTPQVSDAAKKLFRACGRGDLSFVKNILLNSKETLWNQMDEEGNTPIHWAAVGGHEEIVKILLDAGCDIEIKSHDGFTPLHSVAQEDHENVLQLLLDRGADINARNLEDSEHTVLHYASCWGAIKCTKLLLKRGAEIDAKSSDKSTPLIFACEKGNVDIARALIEAGASLENKNDLDEKGGATPLLIAAHNARLPVLELLIEKGAKVNESTVDGLNALHLAIRCGSDRPDILDVLIKAGTDVNKKTISGDTPLHYAAFMGYLGCAQKLLESGAKMEEKGQNESTPLIFAAREGQFSIVKFLVGKGASMKEKDKDGDTALECARINGHNEIVEFLMSQKK